jgi:hypothetical protein
MEQRFNQSGFPIKECPKCKEDYNINSFVGDICFFCDDNSKVKVWIVTNGDHNDIYSKKIIKGTGFQIDDYINGDKPDDAEDIGSDGIGWMTVDDEGLTTEFYEAVEIEDYKNEHINIDLTKEDQ